MKVLCFIDNQNYIPTKFTSFVNILSPENVSHVIDILSYSENDVYIFIPRGFDTTVLLKPIEDCSNNVVCYVVESQSSPFVSRFTQVVSRKRFSLELFSLESDIEYLLNRVKSLI
jgi:hypothetical protein